MQIQIADISVEIVKKKIKNPTKNKIPLPLGVFNNSFIKFIINLKLLSLLLFLFFFFLNS